MRPQKELTSVSPMSLESKANPATKSVSTALNSNFRLVSGVETSGQKSAELLEEQPKFHWNNVFSHLTLLTVLMRCKFNSLLRWFGRMHDSCSIRARTNLNQAWWEKSSICPGGHTMSLLHRPRIRLEIGHHKCWSVWDVHCAQLALKMHCRTRAVVQAPLDSWEAPA